MAELDGLDVVWASFISGGADIADASAAAYLSQQEILDGIEYGQIPMRDGVPHTVAKVWAFAILSDDPEQRALALELIRTLLAPTVHGPWSQFAHLLPTHYGGFRAWSSGHAYYGFLEQLLEEGAISPPNGRLFDQFSRRLHGAAVAVPNPRLVNP